MKIKQLNLKNFRGVKSEASITLNDSQSFLLYGDNGTGKSSFLDAVEWFITDNVSHLGGEEIETHGGLRNTLSDDKEDSVVEISFSNGKGNKKELSVVKDKLKAKFNKKDADFDNMLAALEKERLWLRNTDLVSFIIKTKKDRLSDISTVIGYDEVTKVKATLKKSANDIKSLIKGKNFESLLAGKKGLIAEKIGQVINDEEQFYKAVNVLVKPFVENAKIVDEKSYTECIEKIKSHTDNVKLKERERVETLQKLISEMLLSVEQCESSLSSFSSDFDATIGNQELLKDISFSKLFLEAEKILSVHDKDECLLCLQSIKREDLIEIIRNKSTALSELNSKIESLENSKAVLVQQVRDIYSKLNALIGKIPETKSEYKTEKDFFVAKLEKLASFGKIINQDVVKIKKENLEFKFENFKGYVSSLSKKNEEILSTPKDDINSQKIDLLGKLSVAKQALVELLAMEKEKKILESDFETLDKIFSEFNLKQKEEMMNFLDKISKDMNEFYLFMNENEKVDGIQLVTVDDSNGEFAGIAVKLKFHDQEITSPKKFLSESHLNCLGLCLFLSSVVLFNKTSQFFVLDDVISSFDKNHRYRFGQLLLEKFGNYQILLLSHETEWFEYMSSQVKGKGWKINSTKWSIENGTELDYIATELKEKIENKIKKQEADGLGNLLRKYAERILKDVCVELNAEMSFRYNDRNESRTLDELFSSTRKRIKEKTNLSSSQAVSRFDNSKFFENKSSHDSSYIENISDLKAVYADITSFLGLFQCGDCAKFVSIQNHNKASGKISCRCGKLEIDWKG